MCILFSKLHFFWKGFGKIDKTGFDRIFDTMMIFHETDSRIA